MTPTTRIKLRLARFHLAVAIAALESSAAKLRRSDLTPSALVSP